MPSKKEKQDPESVETPENELSSEYAKKRTVSNVPQDYVDRVYAQLSSSVKDKISCKDCRNILEASIRTLIADVKGGKNVSFTNMMTFKRVERDDRLHKNPKTGGDVFKPAHYVMTMEVKPSLKKEFESIPYTGKCKKSSDKDSDKESESSQKA